MPVRLADVLIVAIALTTAAFFIYTAWVGTYPALIQRPILLGAALALVFLGHVRRVRSSGPLRHAHHALLYGGVFAAAVTMVWLVVSYRAIAEGAGYYGQTEVILATIMLVTLLYATWIAFGAALPLIAIAFLLYALYGRSMPDLISHRGLGWASLATGNYLTTKGVMGMALGVVADVVLFFLLFSSFLAHTGASATFVRLSQLVVGRVRGGPAKIAVVGSALMGTISGSAVANVAASGTITIPMMKSSGYRPQLAASIEAVASSGSQLMPPIMGAAVFIMADMLGMGYAPILLAALIPALLYYANLFLVVDLEAAKSGLSGLEQIDRKQTRAILRDAVFVLAPLVILFAMVMMQYSPRYAALVALGILLVLNLLNPRSRLTLRSYFDGIVDGMISAAPLVVAVAAAGIVIGVVEVTGAGLNLTTLMSQAAQNSLLLLLVLTMVSSIILGMGLPTVACYIILALIVAPVMVRLGVPPLAAHMFVFYFGTLSAITPPIALASFTAAGIAGCSPLQASFTGLRIALPAFLLPYIFVFQPGLLFQGDIVALLIPLMNASMAIVGLSAATVGYFRGPVGPVRRAAFLVGALMAFAPDLLTDALGIALILGAITVGELKARRVSSQRAALAADNSPRGGD